MYVHLLIVLPLSNCDRFTSSASRRPADIADETRHRQRAALLGIGTANPANCVRQDEYADWYFNVTGSEHLTHLKTKMKRMCNCSVPSHAFNCFPMVAGRPVSRRMFIYFIDLI